MKIAAKSVNGSVSSDKMKLRSRPYQERSRKTFDRILVAAADLLDEVGWDGFNTNLLAERSGHRPAAIYRYFPNKLAIVSTLAEQLVAQWDDWLAGFNTRLEAGEDINAIWAYYVRQFPETVRKLPGGMAVRRAMQASPILREIDQKDNELLADQLAVSLTRTMPRLGKTEATAAARILIESAVSVIDLAMDADPNKTKSLMDALLTMHDSYITQLTRRYGETYPEKKNV